MDRIDPYTNDINKEYLKQIKKILPEVFTEVGGEEKVDIDKLLNILGVDMTDDFEKYEFKWKGKTESLKLAGKRSTGTLRPCVEESVDWDTTQNLYIEGDNLEVLKLLQRGYHNSVKMIYIDPPYNTGNDFVYEDDFADNIANYKEVTMQQLRNNPETAGRFHTRWLNMIYPRLRIAKTLLKDDGVIFISIDDNEVANLRKICDEIFGEDNFAAQIPWRKRTAKSDVPFGVSQDYEWILVYARTADFSACLEGGTRKYYETDDLPSRPWRIHDLTKQTSASERPNSFFTMVDPKTGNEYPANPNRTWAITEETFKKYYAENRIVFPGDYDFLNISKPAFRYFKEDDMAKAGDSFGFIPVSTKLPDEIGMTQDGTKEITEMFENKVFGFPKPIALIKYLVKMTTAANPENNDIILDFFSGSATTAQAVMQLNAEDGGNRRFICVQLPELTDENSEAYKAEYKNICEIGKERIRRAGDKIKAELIEKQKQVSLDIENTLNPEKLDIGFRVFKLDTSNLKKWDFGYESGATIEQLTIALQAMIESIKPDRSQLDVVFEIMIKLGIDLNDTVSPIEIGGKTVYVIGPNALIMICLDQNITTAEVSEMAEYAPGNIVFADACFADDTEMANVELLLQDKGIEMRLV